MIPLQFLAGSAALAGMTLGQGADAPWGVLDNLARPDLLPRLRTVRVASESSYDRTGGNDDGFSGKYSFIRKEGDALVIAELKGPGVIQRLWTPTPTDLPLEFYFDGEATPRISAPFRDLFLGRVTGFPEPLVGHGLGGYYSYVPIPYRQSLKIVYRGPVMQFFQINHAATPGPVESFGANWEAAQPSAARAAKELLAGVGSDITARLAPSGAVVQRASVRRAVAPGKRVTLFQARRGGRLLGLRVGPAAAFAGKARDLLLRITWDGARKPAVLCPVGDFFGYSWGDPAMRALFAGVERDTAYVYLPMPYDRSARVEIVSERADGAPIELEAEAIWCDAPRRADEARFYAVWRRENPTTIGAPFTFVNAKGRGHVVAAILQAQGKTPGNTFFFEGDDQATIDGELTIHGTGSEDFFNGGWYDVPGRWDARRGLPLSGCLDYKKPLGRTGAYRFMVPDPVVFHRSLHQAIEHAPEKNNLLTDYVGVTYLYADQPPEDAGTLPAQPLRAVADPERVVFAAGWNLPMRGFSLRNATLTKRSEKVGGGEPSFLSMRATGEDVFGSHFVEIECDLPAAGTYRLGAEVVAGPEMGTMQWRHDGVAVAPAADLHADARGMRTVDLGAAALKQGPNAIMIEIAPRPGSAAIGMDLVTLTFERQAK